MLLKIVLIIVVFIIGFIIYFKHFKSTTKVDNIKKEENQNLIKNESNNQIIISEIKMEDIKNKSNLIEIKDSKLIKHVNNLVPELMQTKNTINNVVKSNNTLYQAIIPKGATLSESSNIKGAVRGFYRNKKGIEGHADLIPVDNSTNMINNTIASGVNITSMIVGQYYMAQIDSKLNDISIEINKIESFQNNEYKGKIFALVAQVKQISTFQLEILNDEEFRKAELNKLNDLEHICIELLGQANYQIESIIEKKINTFEIYDNELKQLSEWYRYQKVLLESLSRISDLKFTLCLGKISIEQCRNLLKEYTNISLNINEKLDKWNNGMIEKFNIDISKSRRKREGIDGALHFVPGLIKENMNYREVSNETILMIKEQTSKYEVNLLTTNNYFNNDVKIISKEDKLYYLPE